MNSPWYGPTSGQSTPSYSRGHRRRRRDVSEGVRVLFPTKVVEDPRLLYRSGPEYEPRTTVHSLLLEVPDVEE